MMIASIVAILAFVGVFGPLAKAFAPFIALGLAFVLAPAIAYLTKGKYYIARENTCSNHTQAIEIQCCICEQEYEPQDTAFCPAYAGPICSLCCSLDARCHDGCKTVAPKKQLSTVGQTLPKTLFQTKLSPQLGARILKYLAIFLSLSSLSGAILGFVYYQQIVLPSKLPPGVTQQVTATLIEVYAVFLVLIGVGTWWLVLTQESRQLAEDELDKQNLLLQQEVRERQQAETQLQEKAQQLEQTLHNLKQAEAQLIQTEKMAALGGLVAGIAHEINTPIGNGVTAVSLLAEKSDDFFELFQKNLVKRSDLKKFVELAQESSHLTLTNLNRAAELIQSFKQVAVDQSSGSKRIFNLKTYLEEILLQLSPKLRSTNQAVQVIGDDMLTLNSYPGVFSQIVTNLVINSLIHAYEPTDRGTITINFYQAPSHLIFEYIDDGKGIPQKNLNKIFEPFFTTKRGQGGSGLGLHIVYNLVTQKLGGSIQCESQLGSGTKFIIKLPNKEV